MFNSPHFCSSVCDRFKMRKQNLLDNASVLVNTRPLPIGASRRGVGKGTITQVKHFTIDLLTKHNLRIVGILWRGMRSVRYCPLGTVRSRAHLDSRRPDCTLAIMQNLAVIIDAAALTL